MSVILVIRHAKRRRCIVLPYAGCLSVPYFPTLFRKRHDFRKKKVIEHKMCFHFIYRFCLKHFSLQVEFNEILWFIYRGFHVKYPLFLSGCSETWIFSTHFLVIPKYKISWKSASGSRVVPCGQKNRHWLKDGRVNRQKEKLIVIFCNFANASEKSLDQQIYADFK